MKKKKKINYEFFSLIKKTIAGTSEVLKLSSFYNDFMTSKDLNREFKEKYSKKFQFDFDIKIIRQSCWPFSTALDEKIQLTEDQYGLDFINTYKEFYKAKQPNLKLQWIFSNVTSEVNSVFTPKKYIFVVNNLQLLILLLFNNPLKTFSFEEVCSILNIEKKEIENHFNAIVESKLIMLAEVGDKFCINRNFSSGPIKISLIPRVRHVVQEEKSVFYIFFFFNLINSFSKYILVRK